MKKIMALVLTLALLLSCAAAWAEEIPHAEKESLGTLRVNKAFDIKYSPLPDGYNLIVFAQDDMTIRADILTENETLPRMYLSIAFSDAWADTERLNDVSEEELESVKATFLEEYPDLEFEMRETVYGTKLLVVIAPSGLDAYVYTIYLGHEIEIHLYPGLEQDRLTDADIERVVAFLSDMDFDPIGEND